VELSPPVARAFSLSPDYSYPQLLVSAPWMAGGALLALLGLGAIWWIWRRRDAELLWGASFLIAAGALTSNVLFPIGTILAERLVYLPSLGVIWMGAVLLHRAIGAASGKARRPLWIAVAVWGALLARAPAGGRWTGGAI